MAYGGELAALASDYREQGRIEAAAHRPPADALHPDQHEVSLRGVAKGHLSTALRIFEGEVNEGARVASEIHRRLADIENHVRQLLSDNSLESTVQVKMADRQSDLAQVAENRIRAEVQYRDFRAKNEITTEAHYPESHVWHFAIVGLCFLIETTANAFFFSNAAGLLAGYGVAMSIAAVNIGAAMILGVGFRYKNLSAPEFKILGWFCLVVFILLSIYLNALFASYRSEYQILIDPTDSAALINAFGNASAEALRVFVLKMHIADLTSFLLLGVGLLLSGLAFWKGYTLDDKYPDHGRFHRFLVACRGAENQKYSALRDEVAAIILQYRTAISSSLNEPGELQSRATAKRAALSNAQAALNHDIRTISNDHNMVLDAYRQQNTAIRGTPPPAYFKSIEPLIDGDPTSLAEPKILELRSANEEAAALRERVQAPLNDKLEETNALASQLLTVTFEEFTSRVEAAAKDNISRSTPTIHRAS